MNYGIVELLVVVAIFITQYEVKVFESVVFDANYHKSLTRSKESKTFIE